MASLYGMLGCMEDMSAYRKRFGAAKTTAPIGLHDMQLPPTQAELMDFFGEHVFRGLFELRLEAQEAYNRGETKPSKSRGSDCSAVDAHPKALLWTRKNNE